MDINTTIYPTYDPILMLDLKGLVEGRRYSRKINNRMSLLVKCDECNEWLVKAGLQMKKLEDEEYLKAKKQGNVKEMLENLLGMDGN